MTEYKEIILDRAIDFSTTKIPNDVEGEPLPGTEPDKPTPALHIVTRKGWGAAPPEFQDKQDAEVPFVVLEHNTGVPSCWNHHQCVKAVRAIQRHHMKKQGEPDILYNFLVGEDGNVYEGRGWEAKPSKNVRAQKEFTHRYDIAYIGPHDPERPNIDLFLTAQELLRYARRNKYIKDDCGFLEIKSDQTISRYVIDIYIFLSCFIFLMTLYYLDLNIN